MTTDPVKGYQLTVLEAFALCYDAGWRFRNLVRAVAVMSAESARYVAATHVNDNGTVDNGLFQINSPEVRPILFKQMVNAAIAYDMWTARGWLPWAAWNSGKAQDMIKTWNLYRYLLKPWAYKRLIPDIPFGT